MPHGRPRLTVNPPAGHGRRLRRRLGRDLVAPLGVFGQGDRITVRRFDTICPGFLQNARSQTCHYTAKWAIGRPARLRALRAQVGREFAKNRGVAGAAVSRTRRRSG
jgi:hypothetical protein